MFIAGEKSIRMKKIRQIEHDDQINQQLTFSPSIQLSQQSFQQNNNGYIVKSNFSTPTRKKSYNMNDNSYNNTYKLNNNTNNNIESERNYEMNMNNESRVGDYLYTHELHASL